jgi:hypothetical protein
MNYYILCFAGMYDDFSYFSTMEILPDLQIPKVHIYELLHDEWIQL